MRIAAAPDSLDLALADAAATEALGARIGAALELGEAVLLFGPLGAGKTTLARGAISAWVGAETEAPSPTYTLVQAYEGPKGGLRHADLYRLASTHEIEEIGLVDALLEEALIVEWPERFAAQAPENRLHVTLSHAGGARRARLEGFGVWRRRLAGGGFDGG
ncbi:MAG: tRNA (adenosine(37)-N6)-threonylcarbamoyltransferase complex ATPase subunit type 1 TsaE [Alphaproteobacteria bacterium]|nr:tRNA (adenosine(37)-N6)-threonylcarbamoyltransferase complex ATPase subunit type 1 TsaE [Alphaproteobacteria bacterium]